MSQKPDPIIADRARLDPKSRLKPRTLVTACALTSLVAGGYLAATYQTGDASAEPRIEIPAAETGASAPPVQQRTFYTGLIDPPAPAPAGPDPVQTQLTRFETMLAEMKDSITALEETGPSTPVPGLATELKTLKESNEALTERIGGIVSAQAEAEEKEAERRAALEREIAELRVGILAGSGGTPRPDVEAEAEHRRELERLRLDAELKAAERAADRALDEAQAERDHARRKELAALETAEAERLDATRHRRETERLQFEADLRARETEAARLAEERARFEAEQEAARAKAEEEAEQVLDKERQRRQSGGIVLDETPDVQLALADGSGIGAATGAASLEDASRTIPEGTLISGILETAIQSDLPGSIRAVVSEDVWSADASQVLLPKGSRLIGRYESEIGTGQTRILVIWSRAITPDHRSIALDAPGSDALGRAGLTGAVDSHFSEKFEAAFLISAVSAIGNLSGNVAAHPVVADTVANGSTTVSDALGGYLSIPPTIHVDQGTPVRVFVQRDLVI